MNRCHPSRYLLLLEKTKVHVVNVEMSDEEMGVAWDYVQFDAGTEFPENEIHTTWFMCNKWTEGVEYKWVTK